MHLGYKDLLQRGGLVRDNFFDFQFIGTMNRFVAPDASTPTHFLELRFRITSGWPVIFGNPEVMPATSL
jgi:hypothetical protein